MKKEIRKRLEQPVEMNLNDENLMKAINCRVVPVVTYIMNVCNLRKGDIEELDKIAKNVLRKEGFHGKQASDERLYAKREDGGRGLKNLYDGRCMMRQVCAACYMTITANEWIRVAWENEYRKEQTLTREAARGNEKSKFSG